MLVKDPSDEDQKFNFKVVKGTEFFNIDPETGVITIKKPFSVRFSVKCPNFLLSLSEKRDAPYTDNYWGRRYHHTFPCDSSVCESDGPTKVSKD